MHTFNVGISGLNEGSNIDIYPNPNNGTFTISMNKSWLQKTATAEISNIFGQTIKHVTINEEKQQLKIDAIPGTYFLKVKSTNFTETIKFTIQ